MIISKQKQFKDILRNAQERSIFIIGCGKCATKLYVGGENEVLEMKEKLVKAGKNITGWTIISSSCNINSWHEVLSGNPGIREYEALLVMSCGGGVSVISKFSPIPVYPALDTESLGGAICEEILKEQCGMCGDCTVWEYGGICPIAMCPKGLLNGPCGGAVEGKCEVDERECAWDRIFDRLKKLGKLEHLEPVKKPKNHAKKLGWP